MRKLLAPAAGLYGLAIKLRTAAYSRGLLRVRRLNQPVVCVGNLTVGGSGKTPLVAAITRILARRGFKPGILTRGYGRQGGPRLIALPPAAKREPDSRTVGDEAALLARALPQIPMVICADRHHGGRFAEEKFAVNVHVLDDGFQHLALRREVDVVALDVTQPFFEDTTLPAGRLREPISGLRRAHMVVLTRVGSQSRPSLESGLHEINAGLQVFHCRTELEGFLEAATGNLLAPEVLRGRQVYAFCGIGNPQAFFDDLRKWGLEVTSTRQFPDHHRYTRSELAAMNLDRPQSGAAALITTEKDLMNLPPDWQVDVPLLACRIEARFTEPEKFEDALLRLLEKSQVGGPAPARPD
ncbi:MAG: tetraacyldisaccharide 4'-kinase [Terriglobia bacterium]